MKYSIEAHSNGKGFYILKGCYEIIAYGLSYNDAFSLYIKLLES